MFEHYEETDSYENRPPGSLSVLNCGAGDLKLHFDPTDPIEAARAERVVLDMLRRGYCLFVEDDQGKLHRAVGYDPTAKSYLITDVPSPSTVEAIGPENGEPITLEPGADISDIGDSVENPKPSKPGRKKGRIAVSAATTRATAFAPTAGG